MLEAQKKPSFTQAFPAAAAIISDFRKAFGAGNVVQTYVEEVGQCLGNPLDETRYTVIAGVDLVVKTKTEGKSRDR